MLLQIDANRRATAVQILQWVLMAVRPLTLRELSAAVEPAVSSSGIFDRVDAMRDQFLYCAQELLDYSG